MATAILLSLILSQVEVRWTPQPMRVTRALYGPVNEMGAWDVAICSDEESEPVAFDSTRVYMAAEPISPIMPKTALMLLMMKGDERWKAKLLRMLDLGIDAGSLLAASYGLPEVAVGVAVAKRFAVSRREALPVFDSKMLLSGRIELQAGECIERVAFAGLTKRARPFRSSFRARKLRPVPSITSVP